MSESDHRFACGWNRSTARAHRGNRKTNLAETDVKGLVFKGRCILPLLLLLAAFLATEFAYPRFAVTDEIAFKAAGRNISQGGAFAAPELESQHADPPLEQVFARYPPLYMWLFGEWTRAVGFGWAACVGYDALISAGLAIIIYGLTDTTLGKLLGPLPARRRIGLAFLTALLTLLFRNAGRPDELGMALGFANAWWLLLPHASSSRKPAVNFISGVLAGLMLCTSPGVFLAFMPFLAALWLRRAEDMRNIAPSLVASALGGGLAAALCLIPLFLAHPHFYLQFFQAVQSRLPYVVLRRFGVITDAWTVLPQSLLILFATVPVLCLGLWHTGRVREVLAFFIAPLAGFALVFFLYDSYWYWWFLQPWFLLIAIVVAADFWRSPRSQLRASIAVGWLGVWLAFASVWPAKDYLIRITLAPEQRLTSNVQKLRELIPPGAQVLTASRSAWWALGKDHSVYDPSFSDIEDLARIEYFVTDSNGTGQVGAWWWPNNTRYDSILRDSFEVISNTLPRTPLRVFGIHITNSAYGFGTIVMRRRPVECIQRTINRLSSD
jgi:hypothetical protein